MKIIKGTVKLIIQRPLKNKTIASVKEDEDNIYMVEFRNRMLEVASVLSEGDEIELECVNQGRIDKHGNHYNNVVATKVTRL